MDPTVVASLISSGASAANSAGDYLSNVFFNKRNQQFAREQATTAYNRAVEQWQRETDSNSPRAELSRLLDAGLNPNLIYQQYGQGASPSLPSVPQGDAVPASASQMSLDASSFLQSKLIDAQIRNLNSESSNRDKMTDAQIMRWAYENDVSVAQANQLAADADLIRAKISEVATNIEHMRSEIALLDEDKRLKGLEYAFQSLTFEGRVSAANAESEAVSLTAVALAYANLANIQSETALNYARKELAKHQVSLTDAQTREATQHAELLSSMLTTESLSQQTIMAQLQTSEGYRQHITYQKGQPLRNIGRFIFRELDVTAKILGQVMSGNVTISKGGTKVIR